MHGKAVGKVVLAVRANDAIGLNSALRCTGTTGDTKALGHETTHQTCMARLVGGQTVLVELFGIADDHLVALMRF